MIKFSSPPLPERKKGFRWPETIPEPALLEILNDVCRIFDISSEEVISPKRTATLTKCRIIYFYVANVLTKNKFNAIAHFINKDHSTYYHDIATSIHGFETNDKKFMASWVIYESQSILWKTYYELHINNTKKAA